VLWLCVAWMGGYEINLLWGSGPGRSLVFGDVAYEAWLQVAGLLCVARGALTTRERAPWMLVGAAFMVWGAGDIYFHAVLAPQGTIPVPSPADAAYLATFPLLFTAMVLLFRSRSGRTSPAQWLDGLTAAMAAAAVSAAIALDAVLGTLGGRPLAVATNLAYPVGDLLILAVITGALVVCGRRRGQVWLWAAAGVGVFCVADAGYLVASAAGTYVVGSWFDIGWLAGPVFLALGAWSDDPEELAHTPAATPSLRHIVLPLVFAVISIGLLLYTGSTHVTWPARLLAAGSLAVVLLRLGLTFHQHTAILAARERDATTDVLTGLGNRRALNAELAAVVREASLERPAVVGIFDLDGFKQYNDAFGHQAGDALLTRLGAKLAESVEGRGHAYRMGGDEFCVLARDGDGTFDDVVQRAAAALVEIGDGFAIGSSYGTVHLPAEAGDAEEALRRADQRMYAHKGLGRASAEQQTRSVLVAALREHMPELGDHTRGVRELAEAVARHLGLPDAEVQRVGSTADLHDIGKVAIPRAILDKPGPLDEEEWHFIRRHTVIGERIIEAAPALADIAGYVRASHERWDGGGYPDALAGEEIPLAARIVAVCDAFDAMIAERPYVASRSTGAAMVELERCAGTQFDPGVIDAFRHVLVQRLASPAGPAH
jgi:diguanylate cyclase (GGDEF)-like protein